MRGKVGLLGLVLWFALIGGNGMDSDRRACETAEEVAAMYPENVADLFDSLDLEREGLREAGDAWKRGDKAEACRLLLDYYGGSEADCSVSLSVGQKNPYFHGWYSALQTKIHSSICGQYEGKVEAEGDFARLRANVESLPTSEVAVDFAGKRLPSYAEVKVEK